MRKIFLFMLTSLDGYYEGPNKSIDWHNVDEEFNDFAIKQLDEIGTLLFGRITYELMATYWPTDDAKKDDPIVSQKMNCMEKFVFSKSLTSITWENAKLIKDNIEDEVRKLKASGGKDIAIFGSSNLVLSLISAGLIDEFRIMINPVVLGGGKVLFNGIKKRLNLRLINTKVFKSGNVLLTYTK